MSSSSITDARPYANAVFAIAKQDSLVHEWNDALQDLACIGVDEYFRDYTNNPLVTNSDSEALVKSILTTLAPTWLSKLEAKVHNLISLLLGEHRLALLPEIANVFHEIMISYEDKKEAIVTSAVALSETQKEKLSANLAKKYGSDLTFVYKQDASIIGGLQVMIGNLSIDNTVAGRMSRLKETLESVR